MQIKGFTYTHLKSHLPYCYKNKLSVTNLQSVDSLSACVEIIHKMHGFNMNSFYYKFEQ